MDIGWKRAPPSPSKRRRPPRPTYGVAWLTARTDARFLSVKAPTRRALELD
jgi:hypothetical protein